MTVIDVPSTSISKNVPSMIEFVDGTNVPCKIVEHTIHAIDLLNVNDNSPDEVVNDLGNGIDITVSYASALDQSPQIPMKKLDTVAARKLSGLCEYFFSATTNYLKDFLLSRLQMIMFVLCF